ncbi:DUF2304 domain-containing protein [Kiritimatiellota bacterium B12222]|nr:DUF2304 domain-containing protein [Kiritimatiellota bacterium B12222]
MTDPSTTQLFWQWMDSFPSLMGISFARLCALLVGVLILVWTGMSYWERRIRLWLTFVLGLLGISLMVLAVDTGLLDVILTSSFLSRIRFLLAVLSISVLAITFETIRISRLRERYALLWLGTGAMVLLTALFPQSIEFFTHVLGVQYVTAVVGVVFTFLLLVSFHFSIALSSLEEDRAKIAQRCALLEMRLAKVEAHVGLALPEAMPLSTSEEVNEPAQREIQGACIASLCVIALSVLAVFLTFMNAGPFQPATFSALIFWAQLLIAGWVWGNLRRGKEAWSSFLFTLVLSSLPVLLIGVLRLHPALAMTAQVVTAFCLLDRGHLLLAGMVMALGIAFSVQAWVFFPAFLLVASFRMCSQRNAEGLRFWEFSFSSCVRLAFVVAVGVVAQVLPFTQPEASVLLPTELPGVKLLGLLGVLVGLVGCAGLFRPKGPSVPAQGSRREPWPVAMGLLYFVFSALFFRENGLTLSLVPALPFLLLPLCEWSMRVLKPKLFLVPAILLAVFQLVYALHMGVV